MNHRLKKALALALLGGGLAIAGSAQAAFPDSKNISAKAPTINAGTDLRISQLYGGGGSQDPTFNRDYVEVFNSSASAVDLSGWSIQYASASGSSWAPVALSGSVAPGGYYLVGLATGTTGAALPTPDATGTTALSATDGKVALVNTTTALSGSCPTGAQIIDLVGYGTANCYEGTAAAPKLSKTEAVFRADDGCTDTDDNAADFSKAAPSPRNSGSPVNTCGAAGTDPAIEVAPVSISASALEGGSSSASFTISNTGDQSLDWTLDLQEARPGISPTATVLFDQTANATTTGSIAFLDLDDPAFYETQAADDFEVPAGETWTIEQVLVGGFAQAPGAATVVANVFIYADAGGSPGAAIYAEMNASLIDSGGDITVTLATPQALVSGTYWISIQPERDWYVDGPWYWLQSATNNGNQFHWRNPGDGFGTGCTTWDTATNCLAATNTDLTFAIYGQGRSSVDACTNPAAVSWLSLDLDTGSTAGGDSDVVTLTLDASALAAGSYAADLCVHSNDPINSLVVVPVAFTVTPSSWMVTSSVGTPSGAITPEGTLPVTAGETATFTLTPDVGYEIHNVTGSCGGSLIGNDFETDPITGNCDVVANFKIEGSNPDIVCTTMNHSIAQDGDGTEINFETGDVQDGFLVVPDAHFNPYMSGGNLTFFWMNGGGAAGDGSNYAVLSPGDTIGSSSFGGTGMANWRAGADGYLGVKFSCSTAGTCYGYMHLTTTGPSGFPATMGDYCWNSAGDPITIVAASTNPSVTKSFTPDSMGQHDTSVVTITLSNPTATDALLTAPLVDNLPAGLEVVSGSGSTDCLAGMGLQQGPSPMASVTLPVGAKIPANGSCSVSFSVTAIGGGVYTNLIAAGELQTDQGNNDSDASATLTVLSDPTIEVDPISLTETLASDATSTQTLIIKNLGDSDLNWTIEETGLRPHQPVVGGGGQAERQSARVSTPSAPFARDFTLAPMAEAIQDGGFELGAPNPYWDEDSLNFGGVLCDMSCSNSPDNAPHSGNWWVWFGGLDAYETGYVSQAVTIPAGSASLSFWLRVPFSSGLAADYMAVSVDGTELWRVTANDSGAYTAAYQQVTVDVSAYADGGSHTVRFDSVVNGGGPETSNFMLDDVSLETGGSSGGSCANATDIPWLSVDIDSGTTTALSSDTVTVSFDATGLAPDTYQANLCVASNDPATPQAMVPVELTVTSNGTTFDVTSSVVAGSGTITPSGTTTVDAYETLSFTLNPAVGYLIDSVTGTCIGTLTGDTFVTDPITGDCTVEANFSAIPLPSIVVSPTSLSFTAMQGTTDTDTLSVTNEGPGVLDYTITRATTSFAPNPAERGNLSKATAVRTPVADDLISAAARGDGSLLHNGPVFFANDPSCEVGTPGLVIHDDDNLPDNGYGWNPSAGTDPKMVDKFTPTSYPMTYNTVCVTFLSLTGLTSAPVKVLVYADDGAGGAPGTLLGSVDATANNIGGGLEQSYQAIDVSSMGLNITSGSVYIGFEWNPVALDTTGDNLFIASSESSSTFADGYSWTATDGWGPTVDGRPSYRALFIRAIEGTTGPVLPGCDNPSHVPWLAVAPTSGSISGFGTNNHTVTANAAGMSPGTYEALICVNSNDPAFPQVEVNVSLTVTADPALADIFSDDFEGDAPVGPIAQAVADPSFEDTSFDGGPNPHWDSDDSNSPGDTVFYSGTSFGIDVHTGDWEAWFGGWRATSSTQWFSQTVTITSGGPRFLNYWRECVATPAGSASLKVYIDGTVVETTDMVANGVDAGWVNRSIDISSYADGGNHEIKFEYVVSGSDDGNVFIDDVTIDATAGSPRSTH